MATPLLSSHCDDVISFLTERAQAAADAQADAEYERRERIERFVTFDDLLEELVALEGEKKREFMTWVASADRASCSCILVELSHAKERIITRRLAQGE
jgi:hypothetical protein